MLQSLRCEPLCKNRPLYKNRPLCKKNHASMWEASSTIRWPLYNKKVGKKVGNQMVGPSAETTTANIWWSLSQCDDDTLPNLRAESTVQGWVLLNDVCSHRKTSPWPQLKIKLPSLQPQQSGKKSDAKKNWWCQDKTITEKIKLLWKEL
jgi:hypothetical protein